MIFATTAIDELHELTDEVQSLLDEINQLIKEHDTRDQIISLLK